MIPASQAYRAFLLTMLRPQRYPEVMPYAGGPIYPPYDVTSWSLPIGMGVETFEVGRVLWRRSRPRPRRSRSRRGRAVRLPRAPAAT